MIRLNYEQASSHLFQKTVEYFENHQYEEGNYNDNRLLESIYDKYSFCLDDCGFDGRYFDFLIDGYIQDELGIKITRYFKIKNGNMYMPSVDEFCQREIEYIDWAFSNEPCTCDWDPADYRDVVEHYLGCTDFEKKWMNNNISEWWKEKGEEVMRAWDEEVKRRREEDEKREEISDSDFDSLISDAKAKADFQIMTFDYLDDHRDDIEDSETEDENYIPACIILTKKP